MTTRAHITINGNSTVHLAAYATNRDGSVVMTGRDCDSAPAFSRGVRVRCQVTSQPLTCKTCIKYAAKL